MATVSTSKRSRALTRVDSQQAGLEPMGPPPRSIARRLRWLFLLPVVAALAVWVAPIVVAKTALRQSVLAALVPGIHGTISAQSASLGWFSPVVFTGIEIRDTEGEPLLTIPQLVGDTQLLSIAGDMSALGQFRADGAHVNLILHEGTSNAEEVLLPWLNKPSSGAGMDLSIDIDNATVTLHDVPNDRTWEIKDVQLSAAMVRSSSLPTRVEAAGAVQTAAGPREWSIGMKQPAGATDAAEPMELVVEASAIPLAIAEPIKRRFAPDLDVSGNLSCELDVKAATGEPAQLSVAGEIGCTELVLGGQLLSGDELRLAKLSVPCRADLEGDKLTVHQMGVLCDLGAASIQGSFPIAGGSVVQQIAALLRENIHIEGNVDLARVAAALPRTLSVRQDTQITSGQVRWSLDSRTTPEGQRWDGLIATSQLVARHQGREVRWQQPVQVTLAAHETAAGPVIENLHCSSSFANLQLAGTLRDFTATGQCDLGRLQSELAQFVDLGALQLAGQGQLNLRCASTSADGFDLQGGGRIDNFVLSTGTGQAWTEDQLTVGIAAAGAMALDGLKRLDRATVNLSSGPDRLDARLLQPVQMATVGRWPLEVSLQGRLAKWTPRLKPVVELDGLDLAGDCDMLATVHVSPEEIELSQSRVNVKGLHAWGYGLYVDEPALEMQAAARWDWAKSQLRIGKATLATSSLSLGTEEVSVALASGTPTVDGTVDFRGDATGLYRWMNDPRTAANWRPVGALSGRAVVSQESSTTNAKINATVDNFALYSADSPATTIWQEPKLKVLGGLVYDAAAQTAKFESVDLQSKMLRLTAGGTIDDLAGARVAAIQGEAEYDWATLSGLLRPYVGDNVSFTGRDKRTFSVNGPLSADWKTKLAAQASAGWSTGNLYGVALGQGAIDAKLSSGLLLLGPLDMQLSEGRVTASPRVRLTAEPMDLLLDKGPLLQQVRITPQMCQNALKYVAPILAEATRADGRVSVDLNGARIPLSDPISGEVTGRLAIHSVNVTPGPLTEAMILAARQIEAVLERKVPPTTSTPTTLLQVTDQSVNFHLAQRRVHHDNMQVKSGKVTIRTRGSVGLDQTLAITAEVPVLDEWIAKEPLLSGMRGQVIQVPITGTLQRPRVDPRVVEQLAQQMVRSTADTLLRDGINQGLDRLFNRN